jgi:hypothetical protein
VILPQTLVTDQSWNGERCVARGVGLMLMPEEAAEIAALPGLDHAVDLLETLVENPG